MTLLDSDKKKNTFTTKKFVSFALASAVTLAATSVTAADLKVSGWLFAVGVDRDSADEIDFGILGNTGAQVSFDLTHDLGNGLTAGSHLRVATFGSANNADTHIDEKSVYLSGKFGKLDLGQSVSASAFLDSYDGSPTYFFDPAGAYNILSATGLSPVAGLGPANFTSSTQRPQRLRYDTPNFNGLTGRLQLSDNGSREYALAYSKNNIIANAFVVDNGNQTVNDTTGLLLAYNAPNGLHVSANRTVQDRASGGEDKVTGWKLGYKKGKHGVSFSATTFDDGAANDYERNNLSYVYQVSPKFQMFGQYTKEERGSLDDSAVAVGAGIFF